MVAYLLPSFKEDTPFHYFMNIYNHSSTIESIYVAKKVGFYA